MHGFTSAADATTSPVNPNPELITPLGSDPVNWIGISVSNLGSLDEDDGFNVFREPVKEGTPVILTGNEIHGTGDDQIGVRFVNIQAPQGTVRFDDLMVVDMQGADTIGIEVVAIGVTDELTTDGSIGLIGQPRNTVVADTVFRAETRRGGFIFGQININDMLFP